jgi:hypothetical protein
MRYIDPPSFVAAALAHHDVLSAMQQHTLDTGTAKESRRSDVFPRLETPIPMYQVRSHTTGLDISRLQPAEAA